jgi:hypothetical protein
MLAGGVLSVARRRSVREARRSGPERGELGRSLVQAGRAGWCLAMRAESEAELGQAPWRRDELEGVGRGELMRMRWWPSAGAWRWGLGAKRAAERGPAEEEQIERGEEAPSEWRWRWR